MTEASGRPVALGRLLRQGWVTYQRLMDAELTASGFGDRRLSDARVLRLCRTTESLTAAGLGRELGISRQAAGKIVQDLSRRGYVSLRTSAEDGREKAITLTARGRRFLDARRRAATAVEERIRASIGEPAYAAMIVGLDALIALDAQAQQPRLWNYVLDRFTLDE